MNKLKAYRVKLNLTQEELAKQSGISIRTIQRIEAGVPPKGHTLSALASALGIAEKDLLETQKASKEVNYTLIKLINLAALPFTLLPILNVVVPIIIMLITKQYQSMAKQIISLQIIWTILTLVIFLTTVLLRNHFYLDDYIPILVLGTLMLVNIFVILRNAVSINQNKELYIKLNFSVI